RTITASSDIVNDPDKVLQLTYFTDTNKWIIGKRGDESIEGIPGSIARTYDSNGNLQSESRYGVTTAYTYQPTGDVHTITDANGHITTLADYFRGIAQTERHGTSSTQPQPVKTITRVANPTGTVASVTITDGTYTRTRDFAYDGLNRLVGIDFP